MPEPTASHAPAAVLPAATHLGPAELVVTDVARSVRFYRDGVALDADERGPRGAALTSGGRDVLLLTEAPAARRAGRNAGLYHFALLFRPRATSSRAGRGAARGDAHPDPGRIRPRHRRGDLPRRPRRQRHRAGGRPPARRVAGAGPGDVRRRPRSRSTWRALLATVEGAPLEPARRHRRDGGTRAPPRRRPRPRPCAFYRDGARPRAAGGAPPERRSCPRAATTITSPSTRGAARGVPPAPADALGLRPGSTVLVPDADALDDLERRLAAAGIAAERDAGGGLVVRDPAGNALVVAVG